MQLCNDSKQDVESFHHPRNFPHVAFQSLPQAILLISISILVGHSWNSYKWNYTVCTLLYLDSFMKYNILKFIHVCSCWTTIHSFLLLNNVPLYDYSGEGNGNPLQCSCLEKPRDGGAWWAAVCGVALSRARMKWLSSSSNKENY